VKITAAKVLAFPVAALAIAALWSFRPATEPSPGDDELLRVTWSETQPRVAAGEWLLVDARDEAQFATRHITGAISLPAHAYAELLQFFTEDHGKEKTVVVYCDSEHGDAADQLAARLQDEAGLADVRVLDGGFPAWQREQ
jgi:rhodanese-related sulfurtransferase